MNIIEAIKSGEPFKRKMYSEWLTYKDGHIYNTKMNLYYNENVMPLYDVVADDYEIKEKAIQINESQFIAACRKYDVYTQYDKFKKELGF